ncbi:MAG: RDD family protein, partial [archaeon]|nr:RDD family protein [archaeon]
AILYATVPYYGTVAAWFGPFWGFNWLLWTVLLGVFEILYFAFLESFYGWSLGKKFMGLKVITLDGKKPDIVKAFIRNVTKFFGILLLIDWIAGLATVGDPHQKFTDRYAGTTVTSITRVPTAPPPPPPA